MSVGIENEVPGTDILISYDEVRKSKGRDLGRSLTASFADSKLMVKLAFHLRFVLEGAGTVISKKPTTARPATYRPWLRNLDRLHIHNHFSSLPGNIASASFIETLPAVIERLTMYVIHHNVSQGTEVFSRIRYLEGAMDPRRPDTRF